MMATLQDYIRHRSAKPSSRPDSPQKFGPPASRIPLSRADVAKGVNFADSNNNNNNNNNYQSVDENNQKQQQLQDDEDFNGSDFDTRDSELESLANLDHRGFDNGSSDGEGSFDGGDLLGADGEPLGGINGKGGWLTSNGNDYEYHQGGSGGGGGGGGGYMAQDDRSDGTSTPQPRVLSDEENLQRDAAAQFNRGVEGHNQGKSENNTSGEEEEEEEEEGDLPQQFYTSIDIDQKREENNRSNPRSSGEVKNNLLQNGAASGSGTMRRRSKDRVGTIRGAAGGGGGGGGGDRSWQDLDDEFRKSGGRIDGESIPFDIDGMLEMLGQRLKLSLRGSAQLILENFWFPYKIYTIRQPSLPYFIFMPQGPHNALEVARMTSDIATMAFVRRYHPSIPVPEVIYFDTDVNNLAGVPFFVTKAIHGQFLGYTDDLKDITSDRRAMMGLLDQLARIHAELLKPPRGFTPTHIGNITFRKDSGGGSGGVGAGASGGPGSSAAAVIAGKNAFITGPLLVTMDDDSDLFDGLSSSSLSPSSSSSSPSGFAASASAAAAAVSSLPDLCMHLFQVSESRTLMDPPRDTKSLRELRSIKRRLAGLLGILPQLPNRLSQLSLFHSNLNLSSVVIDPRTRAITCVPIWRDACILPFALAVSYPREIRPRNAEWRIWVDDATTTNSTSGGRVDENFGYRGVYDARLAKYDLRFASDVWEDEELGRWVKVYELVGGGWRMWVDRVGWIEAELDRVRRM